MYMETDRTEIQRQLQDFLLSEGWIESIDEFDLENSFRGDLKFTGREMGEMLFMTENEFDILISADEEKRTETIGDLLNLIIEKKNL